MPTVIEQAKSVGDYYDGFKPPTTRPDGTAATKSDKEAYKSAYETEHGPPPSPPSVPGPPSPGAGMPAARVGDLCAHGGPIVGPGCQTVRIGGQFAARAMPANDGAGCPMFDALVPHVSGMILKGSMTVKIGGFPAARVSDPVGPPSACKGNAIAQGFDAVKIGDLGAGAARPMSAAPSKPSKPVDPPSQPSRPKQGEFPSMDDIAAEAIRIANQAAAQAGAALAAMCEMGKLGLGSPGTPTVDV